MTETGIESSDRQRDEFFRRTRPMAVALYALGAVAGIGAAAYALRDGSLLAAAGLVAGTLVALVLALAGLLVSTSARAARILIVAIVPPSVILAVVFGDALRSELVLSLGAGILLGTALGMAMLRHRLATDDELWRRQLGFGFDPERPYDWIRGKS